MSTGGTPYIVLYIYKERAFAGKASNKLAAHGMRGVDLNIS
jgi:hypothetical protein